MGLLKKKRDIKKEASSLETFVQQLYWGENLNPEKSKQNISSGIVEITEFGQHSSNGILITSDGYFLTAKHCLEGSFLWQSVMLSNGTSYPISEVCCFNDEEDIAMAKAKIPTESKSMEYKIYQEDYSQKIAVSLITRRQGKLINKYGFCEKPWNKARTPIGEGKFAQWSNHFTLNLDSFTGDSGGSVVSSDGRLMGLWSTGSDEVSYGSASKIEKSLELVSSFAVMLKNSRNV
ncbi:MAG: trypsin-like serine protease [Candidatus Woesearchaeota archaeon]